MRELFLERYCALWRERYGKEPPQSDFLVERYYDPIARKELELDPIRFERDKENRDSLFAAKVAKEAEQERRTKRHALGYLVLTAGKNDLVVPYSDNTAELYLGDDQWILENVENVSVREQLLRTGLKSGLLKPVLAFLGKCWQSRT